MKIFDFLFLLIVLEKTNADAIDDALLQSFLPPVSAACNSNFARAQRKSNQKTSFSFTFSDGTSTWNPEFVQYESQLFQAEMSHSNTGNPNYSWRMRIGSGGNMYSFRGKYGEVIPPQYHKHAPWIDEVCQNVSVNRDKNTNSGKLFFIHQAGTYMVDPPFNNDEPFYSPDIAKACGERTCSFGSWGQQAHVPTIHESDTLYFNGYTDCGDGVIEFTSVVHNSGHSMEQDDLTFFNVPWMGIRHSVLRDVLYSDKDSQELTQIFPINPWPAKSDMRWLDETGGYVTFAQELLVSEEVQSSIKFLLPCKNENDGTKCPDKERLKLVVRFEESFVYSEYHSKRQKMFCGFIKLRKQFEVRSGCRDCNLWLQNKRTQVKFHVKVVIHWAFGAEQLFICPEGGLRTRDLNRMFTRGDEILVSYANVGKGAKDNLALTHVYGSQSPSVSHWAPYQVQVGLSGEFVRDAKIYTVKPRVYVKPGESYVYRQYMITGELLEMEKLGQSWAPEAYEEHVPLGDMKDGENIYLFSTDETIFGASIGDENCNHGAKRCAGKSAPEHNLVAHFAISCGNEFYVGSDKYAFSLRTSSDSNTIIRPYVCDTDTNDDFRATWKMLGYFSEGSCDFLRQANYSSTFCTSSQFPSLLPTAPPSFSSSTSPTLELSTSPTLEPSTSPTLEPTLEPSTSPTLNPSQTASMVPSSLPSIHSSTSPSLSFSFNPTSSNAPSLEPSNFPSTSHPTLSFTPTESNATQAPTFAHSSQPSFEPSLNLSSAPSIFSSNSPTESPSVFSSTSPTSRPSSTFSLNPSTRPSSIFSASPTTSNPTFSPTTSNPTFSPITSNPTFSPTSAPTPRLCAIDIQCNDRLYCNGDEFCWFGFCQTGTPPVCDDRRSSTLDVCSNELGRCTIVCSSDSDCDDGVFCNGQEFCNIDGVCETGRAPSCDDGNPCTFDRCDEQSGVCRHDIDFSCRCGDAVCEYPSEKKTTCPADCRGLVSAFSCGDGVCNAGDGENCRNCPEDCNGETAGPLHRRFCCGDGTSCSDRRCRRRRKTCEDEILGFELWVCGDGVCGRAEDEGSCPHDCTTDGCCGDGVCNAGENCNTCPQDCRRRGTLCCGQGNDCSDRRCRSGGFQCTSYAACTNRRLPQFRFADDDFKDSETFEPDLSFDFAVSTQTISPASHAIPEPRTDTASRPAPPDIRRHRQHKQIDEANQVENKFAY